MRLNSTGKNPCGPLAGIRDRDRRPCEGSSKVSATQPVVSAQAASRYHLDADVRSAWSYLPDAFCATPKHRPAFVPEGYAMISRSSSHCVKLVYTPHVARRCIPMTGIDRSIFSCRTLLIFFVLLGTPMAARSGTLEDSARELARKIADALPTGSEVTIEVRNLSSLAAGEVTNVERTLNAELQNRGFLSPSDGGATIAVRVTLSENMKGFVWSAEIRQDVPRVMLLTFAKPLENRVVSDAMPVILRSEKFWEGRQRILDATIANSSNGDPLLLLLTPDELLIRKVGNDEVWTVQIPPAQFVARDPAGTLTQAGNRIIVKFAPQICSIDIDARTLIECHPADGPPAGRIFEKLELALPNTVHFETGTRSGTLQSGCRGGQLFLAGGPGDYTEPDTIQLFESTVAGGVITEKPLSDFLHFAGPVMALQCIGPTPTAVVHNLQTGNYEAYRISISCGS